MHTCDNEMKNKSFVVPGGVVMASTSRVLLLVTNYAGLFNRELIHEAHQHKGDGNFK